MMGSGMRVFYKFLKYRKHQALKKNISSSDTKMDQLISLQFGVFVVRALPT